MIKITSFILLTIVFNQNVFSQCTTSVTGFGNNSSVTMYNVQGTVQVVLNTNNTVTVNLLSNFSTASGPDVRIFIVDRGNLTDSQLKNTAMFNARPKITMGLLSQFSGVSSFTQNIPNGMNISDFETVYFYCQAFNAFWDFGSFAPFTSANCAALEINEPENNQLQLYPNPVNNELNIQLKNNTASYKIAIYTILGNLVYVSNYKMSNTNNVITIGELNSGVYIVKITDAENNVYEKRFIKK